MSVTEETSVLTRVVVLDHNGARDDGPAAARILALLHEQLE